MKKLIAGLLLLSVSISGFAQSGGKNFIDQNYIEVTGKAELEISPDMIYLKIVLSDKNNKEKLTLSEIEKEMINKLSAFGIDTDKDLSVASFASNLKAYIMKANAVILTKEYQLIVHDSKMVQKIFLELQELGISEAFVEKTEHSKIEQYRREIKVSAIKAAKEKAELLAAALNQKTGKALFVQEAEYMTPYMASNVVQARTYSAITGEKMSNISNESEIDIEFEKIKLGSTMLVRFALE